MSDAQIFGDSEHFNAFEEKALGLPPPFPLTASSDNQTTCPSLSLEMTHLLSGTSSLSHIKEYKCPGRKGLIITIESQGEGEWVKVAFGILPIDSGFFFKLTSRCSQLEWRGCMT